MAAVHNPSGPKYKKPRRRPRSRAAPTDPTDVPPRQQPPTDPSDAVVAPHAEGKKTKAPEGPKTKIGTSIRPRRRQYPHNVNPDTNRYPGGIAEWPGPDPHYCEGLGVTFNKKPGCLGRCCRSTALTWTHPGHTNVAAHIYYSSSSSQDRGHLHRT